MQHLSLLHCPASFWGLSDRSWQRAACVVIDGRNGADVLADKLSGVWKAKGSVVRPSVREVLAAVSGLTVCGKTGTAQVADDGSRDDNAWFTGFIRDAEHPYAIAVVIEEGGAGSNLASRLASRALAQAVKVIG